MITPSSSFLRNVILFDAATCSVMGVALTVGAAQIAGVTAIPPALLMSAGLALFPVAAFMLFVATRATLQPAAVWLVIAGNVAWVAGSLALLVSGWIAPNAFGHAFVGLQALAVAGLAALEYLAFRRAPLTAAA